MLKMDEAKDDDDVRKKIPRYKDKENAAYHWCCCIRDC